jgi:hypothetical protein
MRAAHHFIRCVYLGFSRLLDRQKRRRVHDLQVLVLLSVLVGPDEDERAVSGGDGRRPPGDARLLAQLAKLALAHAVGLRRVGHAL